MLTRAGMAGEPWLLAVVVRVAASAANSDGGMVHMRDRRGHSPGVGAVPRSRVWLRRGARVAACCAVVLILGLLAGGYAAYRVDAFAQGTFRPDDAPTVVQPSDPASAPADQQAEATPVTLGYGASAPIARLRAGQPLNILLLGYGGPGHDGAYLTDSMAVASLDPVTGTIAFISVPRDLWVRLPATADGRGGDWGKINQAYARGVGDAGTFPAGGALASKAVAQVLGIPIDAWIGLDFVGFRQCIDTLGGVDVEVAQTFTDDLCWPFTPSEVLFWQSGRKSAGIRPWME